MAWQKSNKKYNDQTDKSTLDWSAGGTFAMSKRHTFTQINTKLFAFHMTLSNSMVCGLT